MLEILSNQASLWGKNNFEHFTVCHLLTFYICCISVEKEYIYILNSKLLWFICPSWGEDILVHNIKEKHFHSSVVSQHTSVLRGCQPANNLVFQVFMLFSLLSVISDLWRLDCHLYSFIIFMYPVIMKVILN